VRRPFFVRRPGWGTGDPVEVRAETSALTSVVVRTFRGPPAILVAYSYAAARNAATMPGVGLMLAPTLRARVQSGTVRKPRSSGSAW
jgi:hypothetical protein